MAFAETLNDAISGAGTNENQLMRIILWRSEVGVHFPRAQIFSIFQILKLTQILGVSLKFIYLYTCRLI